MRICAYEAPETRSSFGQRCAKGFILGCAEPYHHRCWRVAIDKGGIRVSDTLAWLPKDFVMPGASATERLEAALREAVQYGKQLSAELKRGQDGSSRGIDQPITMLKSIEALADLYLPPVAEAQEAKPRRAEESTTQRETQQLRVPVTATPAVPGSDQGAAEVLSVPAQEAAELLRVPGGATEPAGDRTSSSAGAAPVAAGERAAVVEPAAVQNVHFGDVLANKRRPKKAKPKKAPAAPGVKAQPEAAVAQPPAADAEAVDAASRKQPHSTQQHQKTFKHAYRTLPQGRNRCKRVRGPTASPSPQPEYVPATAEELRRYTVRQLKDLM